MIADKAQALQALNRITDPKSGQGLADAGPFFSSRRTRYCTVMILYFCPATTGSPGRRLLRI